MNFWRFSGQIGHDLLFVNPHVYVTPGPNLFVDGRRVTRDKQLVEKLQYINFLERCGTVFNLYFFTLPLLLCFG